MVNATGQVISPVAARVTTPARKASSSTGGSEAVPTPGTATRTSCRSAATSIGPIALPPAGPDWLSAAGADANATGRAVVELAITSHQSSIRDGHDIRA